MTEWTLETLKEHFDALRHADEKALRIKEEADNKALELARSIQEFKDEKANELRSQIEGERGMYVTQSDLRGAVEKIEAHIKPLSEFVTTQQGRRSGIGTSAGVLVGALTGAGAIIGLIIALANALGN